jgi:hypothetical protein
MPTLFVNRIVIDQRKPPTCVWTLEKPQGLIRAALFTAGCRISAQPLEKHGDHCPFCAGLIEMADA